MTSCEVQLNQSAVSCVTQESMKLMGMKGYLHWFAWMFKYALMLAFTSLLLTIFFHISPKEGGMINFTDYTVTYVFFLLYSLSVISFSFAIASFFSHGNSFTSYHLVIIYIP